MNLLFLYFLYKFPLTLLNLREKWISATFFCLYACIFLYFTQFWIVIQPVLSCFCFYFIFLGDQLNYLTSLFLVIIIFRKCIFEEAEVSFWSTTKKELWISKLLHFFKESEQKLRESFNYNSSTHLFYIIYNNFCINKTILPHLF